MDLGVAEAVYKGVTNNLLGVVMIWFVYEPLIAQW